MPSCMNEESAQLLPLPYDEGGFVCHVETTRLFPFSAQDAFIVQMLQEKEDAVKQCEVIPSVS